MAHALHYPSIEFQNLNSLKRSLLVWDRIQRIVPEGYRPQDQPEVKVAVSEEAIINLKIGNDEKSNAANRFLSFYSERKGKYSGLTWPTGFSPWGFSRLNPDKIDVKLLPFIEKLSNRYLDGFLEINAEISNAYMFFLASEIAKSRNLELTTDSSNIWTVGSYFTNEGCFSEQISSCEADSYLASLAINDLLPQDLSSVGIDEIFKFREKTVEIRKEFHDQLNSLRSELSHNESKVNAKLLVEDFILGLNKAKSEYRKSMWFFNKNDVCTLLSVGLPVTVGILEFPGVNPYSPLWLSAGTAIGAVAALANREMQSKPQSIGSFLVHAENLSLQNQNSVLSRKFKEFICDE